MLSLSVAVFALLAVVASTDVKQCPGHRAKHLENSVQLSPCKKFPCKLKKGTNQYIDIEFTPDSDIEKITNKVYANIFGVNVPFIGVDGNSICHKIHDENGEKAPCPLKAGNKYSYNDSFPILDIYPTINVNVHWALNAGGQDIVCFEVPAKIVK